MLNETYPYYLAGRAEWANAELAVTNKYSGEVVTRVAKAGPEAIERAIAAAVAAAEPMRRLPGWRRREVLQFCVLRLRERADELARMLCIEAGKPIRDSRGEVARLIDTFEIAAEQATRATGEVLPLDRTPRAEGYLGFWRRVPVGPCAFITPFNFPLNLAAHKIAPALAAGCPFVLKPASATPLGALAIGEVLAEAGLPEGAFSILPCARSDAAPLVEDDRLKLISFTGSADVGWDIKRRAGRKRVSLELGGNAGCIVDRDADIEDAVSRLVTGIFYQSGQSCISVQRILVHREIYDRLRDRLVEAARALEAGDPADEETFIGPLISEGDAERLEQWIASARARGARVLCGGGRRGALLEPTLLEDVPRDEPLCAEEAFGPVAVLAPFDDFDAALAEINDSRYGLQAGVFTRDLERAMRAWESLEVGGVIVGDVPSWRVDHMPYGGVKESGFGREGIRWAMEEMSEVRLLVVRRPPATQ